MPLDLPQNIDTLREAGAVIYADALQLADGVRGAEIVILSIALGKALAPILVAREATPEEVGRVIQTTTSLAIAVETTMRQKGEAAPEPPWPVGTLTNCKRAGWQAFYEGKPREPCPFPPDRRDLKLGYEEGWDAAKERAGG